MNAHVLMNSGSDGAAWCRWRRQVVRGSLTALLLALISGPALAWDEALAGVYEKFFARFDEQGTAKALQLMPVEKVLEAVHQGEPMVIIDVRTRREQGVIGLTLPGALALPMNEVFEPGNLARLPADQRIVVACHTGPRAMTVALALRSLGFDKVFVMKGGLAELMRYLDVKTAFPAPPPPAPGGPPAR